MEEVEVGVSEAMVGVPVGVSVGVEVAVSRTGKAVEVSAAVGVTAALVLVASGGRVGWAVVVNSTTSGLALGIPGLAGTLHRLASPSSRKVKIRWNWRGKVRCIARLLPVKFAGAPV